MGYGMAQSLVRAGHRVHGFDICPDAITRLQNEGGQTGDQATAAPASDILVIVVLNAAQTEGVLFGPDRWAAQLKTGATVVACAAVAPDFAKVDARNAGSTLPRET